MVDPVGHQGTHFFHLLMLDLAHPLFADTKVLSEHCQRYGFIARPPCPNNDALPLGERIGRFSEPSGAAHVINVFEYGLFRKRPSVDDKVLPFGFTVFAQR